MRSITFTGWRFYLIVAVIALGAFNAIADLAVLVFGTHDSCAQILRQYWESER